MKLSPIYAALLTSVACISTANAAQVTQDIADGYGAELSFIFGNEVNAVSGPTVFSEKDHQAKGVLMSNWLKSKTFEPYS